MGTVLLCISYLISCFVCSAVIFMFLENRYQRAFSDRRIYTGIIVGASAVLAFINFLDNPRLNLASWFAVVAVGAGIFYCEENTSRIKRIVESEVFFVTVAFTETMGVLLAEVFLQLVKITEPVLKTCISVLFSKVVIVLYYLFVKTIISDKPVAEKNDRKKYIVSAVVILFSVGTLALVTDFFRKLDVGIVAINVSFIVFVDLYMLSFLKSANDRKLYEEKVRMLEQQAKLQYGYYVQQEKKYNDTLRILHDVNKHIQTINELSLTGNAASTRDYAEQIKDTLKPLIPVAFTDNPILNILLSDKLGQTKEKGIKFEIKIGGVSFHFMEAIDITTIFGNLLDNAIDACEAVQGVPEKEILLSAEKIQEMVSVTLINDSLPVRWKAGMPVSEKGEHRGIGLLNVQKSIEKYDGSIKMREKDGKFITEFFLNIGEDNFQKYKFVSRA